METKCRGRRCKPAAVQPKLSEVGRGADFAFGLSSIVTSQACIYSICLYSCSECVGLLTTFI